MANQVESGYAFIFVESSSNHYYIDFYIRKHMLAQLQLLPGSVVLVKGLEEKDVVQIQLRPSKGSENPEFPGKYPFIASIRFPNRPSTLRNFLAQAHDSEISFTSIRTQGFRGEATADVSFEGKVTTVVPHFHDGDAIGQGLALAARTERGDVISCDPIAFGLFKEARVLSSTYWTELPLIRGSYGKIRLATKGKFEPLKDFRGTLGIVRAQLDVQGMTVTLDLSIAKLCAYLLSFKSIGLKPASPVTQTILEELQKENTNLEALDAFEYLEYEPTALTGPASGGGPTTGTIEMLFTSPTSLDSDATGSSLSATLDSKGWSPRKPVVKVFSLLKELAKPNRARVPEDTECLFFRKALSNGRYLCVGHLGAGAFGVVNEYFDSDEIRLVAGKHIVGDSKLTSEELEALMLGKNTQECPNLVTYLHGFFDGAMPVVITDLMDGVLDNHVSNPDGPHRQKANQLNKSEDEMEPKNSIRIHSHPGTVLELIDMAIQVLNGLSALHTGGDRALLHRDVKPANIGFVEEDGRIIWKLLDFGLARGLPPGADFRTATVPAGTRYYMSPQAIMGLDYPSNDLYSLGMTLFRVLNDWRFPSDVGTTKFGFRFFEEVEDFVLLHKIKELSKAPTGFARKQWRVGKPFSGEKISGRDEVFPKLQDIIFRMMDFRVGKDGEGRYMTAGEVIGEFTQLRSAFLEAEQS